MSIRLANFIKHNGWGRDRLKTEEDGLHRYFSAIRLVGEEVVAGQKDELLILSPAFFTRTGWSERLTRLKQSGAVAAAYVEKQNPPESISQAIELCNQLNLPLLELPEHTYIHDLLRQCEQMFINEDGQAVTIHEIMNALRHAMYKHKFNGLLRTLHTWLGCQAIILIDFDVFAFPPISDCDGFHVDPRHRKRLRQSASFPWVESYYFARDETYEIHCQIIYDGRPLGVLILSRKERAFDDKELAVADFAAVLCVGIDRTFVKSQVIQRTLTDAYQGTTTDAEDVLLPEEGYALVLREITPETSRRSNTRLEQAFLGYLIHACFGNSTYYALLESGELLLFCSTEDVRVYTKNLLALLRKTKRSFLAGVSQRYPRKKINAAFAEAKHAADIGQYLDSKQEAYYFCDLGIYRLFNYTEYGWPINQMLDEMTDKLHALDPEKMRVLTATLTCLVQNNFNYAKTAEKMYTHPNTIRYRISLLEDLWGTDLSKEDDRLLFGVLGKLLPLWKRYTGRT